MSLVSTLLQSSNNSGIDTSALEATMHVYESESFLNDAYTNLVIELCSVNEAYDTADVIGCVKVLTEGANPTVLMEGMVTSGIDKLKAAWEKFRAAIKKFFSKVIDMFKSIVLTGKKFTKEFGNKLRAKADKKKDFEYKGYKFTIETGNNMVDKVYTAGTTMFNTLTQKGLDPAKVSKLSNDELLNALNLANGDSKKSQSDIQDEVVKSSSVASDFSDLNEKLFESYRDNDSDKGTHVLDGGKSEVNNMITFIDSCNGAIKEFQKDESKYESMINNIIKNLDKMKNKSSDDEGQNNKYKAASAVSTACSAILSVHKLATNAKINAYKSCNRQYLAVLKSFLRSGFMATESVTLEAEDMDDFDMDDADLTDDVAEAATNGADDPEGGIKDIGIVASEGKKCDGEDLLEEAMKYI